MKMMKYAQMLRINCSFILEDFTDWLTYGVNNFNKLTFKQGKLAQEESSEERVGHLDQGLRSRSRS